MRNLPWGNRWPWQDKGLWHKRGPWDKGRFYDESIEHWYKADRETQYADGDAVGSATDWIKGENAVQAVATAKPTFKTSIVNGKAVFRFDGGDCLQSLAFASEMAQPNTIYVVIKATNVADYRIIFDGIAINKQHYLYYDNANPGRLVLATDIGIVSTDTTHNSWIILCGVFNGASSELFKNNASIKSGDAGANPLSGVTIGAKYDDAAQFIGDQAEIIVCSGAHDAARRLKFYGYLGKEHEITFVW